MIQEWKDAGKKVFSEVYLGAELYSGKYLENAPDLVLGFSPGYRMSWKSALGDIDEELLSDNESPWCGDHLIDGEKVPGVLFSTRELAERDVSLLDLAPSVLEFFRLEKEQQHEGESFFT